VVAFDGEVQDLQLERAVCQTHLADVFGVAGWRS
jgi:hypothetical protein